MESPQPEFWKRKSSLVNHSAIVLPNVPFFLEEPDLLSSVRSYITEIQGIQDSSSEIPDVFRIVSRNTGKPTKFVKIMLKSKDASDRLIEQGEMRLRFKHHGLARTFTVQAAHRPRNRPTRCYRCQEFGHQAKVCQNQARCVRCSEDHDRHANCDEKPVLCSNCGSKDHQANSSDCPTYQRNLVDYNSSYKPKPSQYVRRSEFVALQQEVQQLKTALAALTTPRQSNPAIQKTWERFQIRAKTKRTTSDNRPEIKPKKTRQSPVQRQPSPPPMKPVQRQPSPPRVKPAKPAEPIQEPRAPAPEPAMEPAPTTTNQMSAEDLETIRKALIDCQQAAQEFHSAMPSSQ